MFFTKITISQNSVDLEMSNLAWRHTLRHYMGQGQKFWGQGQTFDFRAYKGQKSVSPSNFFIFQYFSLKFKMKHI